MPLELRQHLGRPVLFCDGKPAALATYSPVSAKRWDLFKKQTQRFLDDGFDTFFLTLPARHPFQADYGASPFWVGDAISSVPLAESTPGFQDMVEFILASQPEAKFFIRFNPCEPRTWKDLHPDEFFISEIGEYVDTASMASQLYWQASADFGRAVVEHCQSHAWQDRILGYWYGPNYEGTPLSIIQHWLFDHGPRMTERWREFLRRKYSRIETLREAHGDPALEFDSIPVPSDHLRRTLPEVARLPYWLPAAENQPLRDYLELVRELFHGYAILMAETMRTAAGPDRLVLFDMLKVPMQGWAIFGFFDKSTPWPVHFPETLAGSGHQGVSRILDHPGLSGLVTPHDYHHRGNGAIYEPEGLADSAVLRGKIFFCEMDTRSWCGSDKIGGARDIREYEAITWRNLAATWTRGFHSYWMDVFEDWFATPEIHEVTRRQAAICREAISWPHETVPGIAVILDEEGAMETNGSGAFYHESILWEIRGGLARCGVPYRIYTLDDLDLPNFPDHRVLYFPNHFRVDERRLARLQQRVFRDGRVVVWGPGSGISDGKTIHADHATRLTGFTFDWEPLNFPRRTLVTDASHPVTRRVAPGTLLSNSLAYGPCLYPSNGRSLGEAQTKAGRAASGMSVLEFGKGPGPSEGRGEGDYGAFFTSSVPLNAQLWQGLTEWAGGHIYSESGDVLMASKHLVALHSAASGRKTLQLPAPATARDVVSGRVLGESLSTLTFDLNAPETRVFQLSGI